MAGVPAHAVDNGARLMAFFAMLMCLVNTLVFIWRESKPAEEREEQETDD